MADRPRQRLKLLVEHESSLMFYEDAKCPSWPSKDISQEWEHQQKLNQQVDVNQPLAPGHIESKCSQHRSTSSIQLRFGKLVCETYKSLKARYTLEDFKCHLVKLRPSLDEASIEKIASAESHTEALLAVNHLWSWNEHQMFKKLILALGNEDDLQLLEIYDHELAQYIADKDR